MNGPTEPQAWCDWRNREMVRRDLEWIVGPSGTPMLVDRQSWSIARTKELERTNEAERQRFNHRLLHPIAEPAE